MSINNSTLVQQVLKIMQFKLYNIFKPWLFNKKYCDILTNIYNYITQIELSNYQIIQFFLFVPQFVKITISNI